MSPPIVIIGASPLATPAPLTLFALAVPAQAQSIGRLSANPYQQDSTSNPHSSVGSPYSPSSINNPHGTYGSPYSPNSVNNPHGAGSPYRQDSPNNPYGQGWTIVVPDNRR